MILVLKSSLLFQFQLRNTYFELKTFSKFNIRGRYPTGRYIDSFVEAIVTKFNSIYPNFLSLSLGSLLSSPYTNNLLPREFSL